MPQEPSLEAAAEDEVRSLELDNPLTSCRVSVSRSKHGSHPPSYNIRIAVLSGAKLLSAEYECSHDPPGMALHRAFAQIHSHLQ
jgi:hypothetical protein